MPVTTPDTGPDDLGDVGVDPAVFPDDEDPALAGLPFVTYELVVQPYPGADSRTLEQLYAVAGAVVTDELSEIDAAVLEVPADELPEIAAAMHDSGLIEQVHKNYVYESQAVPNDPLYSRQPHLAQIRAAEAWDRSVGSAEIVIAVVDSGVQRDHPDLAAKIVGGWNVSGRNADYGDMTGHGTQVAGVAAAASHNAVGVSGVAWESPILAVRATDATGQVSSREIAAGILWSAGQGAKVINVSFAPLWSNSLVRAAAQRAHAQGALVVISAGNNGGVTQSLGYREALFVGAISGANSIASFSDRGPFVDLVAPGTGIRTTSASSGYGLTNGTSFAAPIVSGVAALAWSANPDLRPITIANLLLENALDLGAEGKDVTYGNGAVDAASAVQAALSASYVPDLTPPVLNIVRPATGDTITGRSTVMVAATDPWGVADVTLSIDGVPYATDPQAPYQFLVDPATLGPGPHELSFVASDLAGNASAARTVSVEFALAGAGGDASAQIVFRSPRPGTVVTGTVTIQATISASAGLGVVEWFVDGTSVLSSVVNGQTSGVSYAWRAAGASAGVHTITIAVTDLRGQTTFGSLELITGA